MPAPGARSPAAEPPLELVARFKEALDRLWPEGGKLGLAVSGGPDSMAMLLLAEAAIPGQFEVATVDHGLRPESADECEMVARICADRGIPCEVLPVEVGSGNLQAMARAARYRALARWGEQQHLAAIATAHHADDQAETLLMRLNRGSGIRGLAGVRSRAHISGTDLILIRPVLRFRRAELGEVVMRAGVAPAIDSSNADPSYDRVRIRNAIAEAEWLDPLAMAKSAELLAETEEALDFAILQQWQRAVTDSGDGLRCYIDKAGIESTPRALVIGVLGTIFGQLEAAPSDAELARLLDALLAGDRMNLAGVQATPGSAGGERLWFFEPENPRRTR